MTRMAGIELDQSFISRLLLGALSEHEQRMLAVRWLRVDPAARTDARTVLELFEMFDSAFVAEYARVLASNPPVEESKLTEIRNDILERATCKEQLGARMRAFTVADLLGLGRVTRRFFSWSMSELLLERGRREKHDRHRARTSLHLALMVIDVVELLTICGLYPEYPSVVADVRRRIRAAYADLGS